MTLEIMDESTTTIKAEPSLLSCIKRDIERVVRCNPGPARSLIVVLTNRGFQAVLLYRISRALWKHRVPILPLIFTRLAQHLFAIDISYMADLGPGIVIMHGFGLVIGNQVRVEGDCYFYQGVTLGTKGTEWVSSEETDGQPVIGREVMFGAGAKALGPIHIGQNCVIGANAVVLRDVPPNSVAVGVPARVVGHRPMPPWADKQIEAPYAESKEQHIEG